MVSFVVVRVDKTAFHTPPLLLRLSTIIIYKRTFVNSILKFLSKTARFFTIEIQKNIGYLPSEVNLYEEYTVGEMLNFHESFYENVHENRKKLVKKLNLDESKKIQNPICKFSKAMLYYETDFFGGA